MKYLICFLLIFPFSLSAQTYFYVTDLQIIPENPVVGDELSVHVFGDFSSSGTYLTEASAYLSIENVLLTLDAEDPGGLAVITPHDTVISIGTALLPGDYTIIVSGQNTDDFVSDSTAYYFTVSTVDGVDENEEDRLKIFSDQGILTIRSLDMTLLESYMLVDVKGTLVFSGKVERSDSFTMDVSALSKGVYHFVYMYDGVRASKAVYLE